MPNSVEVPVDAAREIADAYAKDIVVIVAWDEINNRVHVTTYGQSARHKQPAAKIADILACAADLTQKVGFEDFRHRTEAEWAEERARLLRRIRGLTATDPTPSPPAAPPTPAGSAPTPTP